MDKIDEIECTKHVCELQLDKAKKTLDKAVWAEAPEFSITRFEAEVFIYEIALIEINKQLAEALEKT